MDLIRCPKCKSYFKRNDNVVIDELNTLIHVKCLDDNHKFLIKHSGPFHYIKNKYSFLRPLDE
mgnify:CR=1 FL=1